MARRRRQVRSKRELPSDTIELVLENVAHGGAVTAHGADGRLYFVRYGLPGETVMARVTAQQSKFSWAEVESVIEPSELRDGDWKDSAADLRHVSRAGQMAWKSQVLTDQLRRVGGAAVAQQVASLFPGGEVPVHPAPGDSADTHVWGRRTRAKFRVTGKGELGIHSYRSHRLFPVHDYPMLDSSLEESGVFTEPRWKKIWKPGDTVTLVAPTGSAPVVLVGKRAYDLAGAGVEPAVEWEVKAQAGSTRFRVSAGGFWQAHREAAALLVDQVLEASGELEGKNVMELYSGAGLFTRYLVSAVGPDGRVASLEGSEMSVADAEWNLRQEVRDGRVELFVGFVDAEAVGELDASLPGGADVVVLDPPREGAGRGVIQAITRTDCQRVVLVSCDPAAGSRDLRYLVDGGFRISKLSAWDLFPGTHHLEFVAELVR